MSRDIEAERDRYEAAYRGALRRARDDLDWIYATPEDPHEVQVLARSAMARIDEVLKEHGTEAKP